MTCFDSWTDYLRFRAQFIAMLDPALYTADWLDTMVYTGQFTVCAGSASAVMFSIKTYPTGLKEVHGEAAVGKVAEIARLLIPRIIQLGKDHDCRVAVIQSRPGWARVLKDEGWEPFQTSIRKAL